MKPQPVIEWIGATPSAWSQARVKAMFRDDSGSISMQQLAELEVQHYSIPNFDEFGAPAREEGASIASNKTLLHGGEILFSKLNCHKPRIWLVPHDEQVKVASTEFIPLAEWHPGSVEKRFMIYLLGSAVFAEYMTCFQTSVTNSHRRINPDDLWQTRVPLPPLPEQQRIAAYLDASCAAIDAAVVAKRRQLETLESVRRATIQNVITKGLTLAVKMRITGIPLMENIPAHWGTDRLRDVADINSSSLAANTDPTYEFDYLEISNVNSYGIVDTSAIERIRFEDAPSRARRCVTKNNTLISSVRPNLQAVLFVSEHRNDFVCSTGFNVVQPNEARLRPKFIYYALISDSGRQHFEATAKGVGYPAIDDKDFGAFIVPLPPLEEQEAICVYLDKKLGEVKRIVVGIESQIATLTAYRKSLIHECVTGQRRVTEADVVQA